MTIDALRAGLRVVEVEVDLHHNPTGKDLAGLLHRARQARAIARVLTRRRAWRPAANGARHPAASAAQRPTVSGGRPAASGGRDTAAPADAGSPGREGSPGTRGGAGEFPQPPDPPSTRDR
jgi:hypothetical protein